MAASTYKWDSDGIRAVAADGGDPGNFMLGATNRPSGPMVRTRYVALAATNATSAVQYKIMTIPAYTWVSTVQLYVVGGTDNVTIGLGDTDAATTFATTVNISSGTGVGTVWNTGKLYTSADEVNFTPSNTGTASAFYVQVQYNTITNAGGN